MIRVEEIPPTKERRLAGPKSVPKKIPEMNDLIIATFKPKPGDTRIIPNRIKLLDSPGLSQGKNRGSGDSMI